eukprot:TRINITY_DN2495_c2_g1_i1.p1 TRINITY_DN2495_c2_g1~~TRINITY_DN2495_c2_g1_i1.p1  ORF type:complete len:200 (+),score=1.73 TRINITY_DN2495_c2_g1_i1:91-600(+)
MTAYPGQRKPYPQSTPYATPPQTWNPCFYNRYENKSSSSLLSSLIYITILKFNDQFRVEYREQPFENKRFAPRRKNKQVYKRTTRALRVCDQITRFNFCFMYKNVSPLYTNFSRTKAVALPPLTQFVRFQEFVFLFQQRAWPKSSNLTTSSKNAFKPSNFQADIKQLSE